MSAGAAFTPHESARRPLSRLETLALTLIVLLAFGVRVHLLGAQSLWNDEGSSYVQAGRAFDEIAFHTARDIHPPLYYWLLKVWAALTGTSEFALRAFSALASVLSVACAALAGRRLFGTAAGLAAGLFMALNSFSVYYAQEARMYALLALWAAAALWLFAEFLRAPGWRWALPLALVNAAGLWTQYTYAFVLLAQGAAFVAVVLAGAGPARAGARLWRGYILANLLTVALYLPWLGTAWTQLTTWPSTGQPAALAEGLGTIAGWLTLGSAYSAADASWVAVALMLLVFGLRVERGRPAAVRGALLVALWTAAPVFLFLALGLYRPANLKFLLPAQIGCALWMARGTGALWALEAGPRAPLVRALPRAAAALAALGLAATMWAALGALYHDAAFQRADYRGLAADIAAASGPDDAIILDAPNQEEVFRYYYRGALPVYPLPAGLGGDDAAARAAAQGVIDAHRQVFAVFWGEAERDPRRVVEQALAAGAYEAASRWYGDVRLARYVASADLSVTAESGARFGDQITLVSYALSGVTVTPGETLQLRLDWRTDSPLAARYKVTVQLLDAGGALVAQRDSEPGGGLALTTTWPPGDIVSDGHALLVPDSLAPAQYALIVGLYDMDNPQERLPVGGADRLRLADITVR